MRNEYLLGLIKVYLIVTPLVSSLNGLSMHMFDVSLIGPIYHSIFSVIIILSGLLSGSVEKNWRLVFLFFGYFFLVVLLQLVLGFSSFLDVGQLYKWFFPLLFFATFFRWEYLREDRAQRTLVRTFNTLPLVYAALISLSAVAYFVFGFEATLFDLGAKRFTGFTFGYNYSVNALILCGLVNYVYFDTTIRKKLISSLAFFFLRSKVSLLYFGMVGFSFLNKRGNLRNIKLIPSVLGLTILLIMLWFGYQQSLRSADLYGNTVDGSLDSEFLLDRLQGGRVAWVLFFLDDFPEWPLTNKLIGNGINIDRRMVNSEYDILVGASFYSDAILSKGNKNAEMDLIGPIDMFGLSGMFFFVAVFYIYPLQKIRLPFFRPMYVVIILLSLYGGHVTNNPQVSPLLVFLILFLQNHKMSVAGRSNQVAIRTRLAWQASPENNLARKGSAT